MEVRLVNLRRILNYGGVPLFSRAFLLFIKRIFVARQFRNSIITFSSKDELVIKHFETWSQLSHPAFLNFRFIFSILPSNSQMLETGTAAWGCESTRLLDSLTVFAGGSLISIDIRTAPSLELKHQLSCNTTLITSDSVIFLKNLSFHKSTKFDFIYLDSMDLNLDHPDSCAQHCLEEFEALSGFMDVGTIILIDDTPKTLDFFLPQDRMKAKSFLTQFNQLPGKGSKVFSYVVARPEKYKILLHNYQFCFQQISQ